MSQNPQPPFDPSRGGGNQPQPYGQQPGGQQPYAPHPGGQQGTVFAPTPPPKKRRVWLWILIAILAVFLVIIVACSAVIASVSGTAGAGAPASSAAAEDPSASTGSSTKAPKDQGSSQPGSTAAKIGDTVKAGDWQFKVTDFDCGHKSVGDSNLGKKAQGQFCFLQITAKNNGDDEGTLDGDSQKLLDDDGKTYSSDTEASLYEDPKDTLFLEGVNPGNTAKGLVVFDVPKNAKITGVSLQGGFFGKSAEVSLR